MKRRDFLAAGCMAGLASTGRMGLAEGSDKPGSKQFYELRLVRMESQAQQDAKVRFLAEAAIPAMNRIGIEPVGAFTMLEEESPDLYMLLPHDSLESVATWLHKLAQDEKFLEAGAEVINAPKDDPAYIRMENSLLWAFDKMPKLEVPSKKKTRVFQLRIYESHSVAAGRRKIEMFNEGGEIAVFRKTGLTPVFFGEALVGTKLPNLTYMLGFDDVEAKEAAWEAFLADPDWEKLKNDPYYKDTVSNITNIMLRPAACSQI